MPDMECIQIPRITLDDVMSRHKISLIRLASVSGVPKTTLHRVRTNNSAVVRLEHLQAILNALCELTGQCYGVEDIIKVHYKGQESHDSLPDEARDSDFSGSKESLDSVAYIQQPDGHYKDGYHNEQ